jgi:mannose-6-phosphate isomerase
VKYQYHLKEKSLLSILNKEKAKAGDVFFLPAGRIHAIGAGILLAEIQQTSDATLRIFDFDRVDEHGKPRELHTEKALEAIDFNPVKNYKTTYASKPDHPVQLAKCPYFTTNLIELNIALQSDYHALDSFIIFMCLEGSFTIQYYDTEKVDVSKGETILVPAELKNIILVPAPRAKILEVYIEGINRHDHSDELLDRLI